MLKLALATDAYELKTGGWRGVVVNYLNNKERLASPLFTTRDEAGNWAMKTAHQIWKDLQVTVGHYNGNRYRKNYFLV